MYIKNNLWFEVFSFKFLKNTISRILQVNHKFSLKFDKKLRI